MRKPPGGQRPSRGKFSGGRRFGSKSGRPVGEPGRAGGGAARAGGPPREGGAGGGRSGKGARVRVLGSKKPAAVGGKFTRFAKPKRDGARPARPGAGLARDDASGARDARGAERQTRGGERSSARQDGARAGGPRGRGGGAGQSGKPRGAGFGKRPEGGRGRDGGASAAGAVKLRTRSSATGAERWKERAEHHAAVRKAPKGDRQDERGRGRGGDDARPGKRPQRLGQLADPHAKAIPEPMRIAKAMARVGLCSRREAERWIEEGRVSVNGRVLTSPALEVKPSDRVMVDGKPLPVAEPAQLWRYYKPKGLVTTHNDPQGRPTVFDNLPAGLPRVVSVGRLDFNTEGLILLTNDGELARHLELPATAWLRRYRVRAKGRITQVDLDLIKDGLEIEGVKYGPVEAVIDTMQGANMWLTIGIREGKNREVRKVLSSLGLEVNRLIRISFGPFQLMEMQPGEVEHVRRRVLADQLGPKLASEFGLVDDEVPTSAGRGKPGQKGPGGAKKAAGGGRSEGKSPEFKRPDTRGRGGQPFSEREEEPKRRDGGAQRAAQSSARVEDDVRVSQAHAAAPKKLGFGRLRKIGMGVKRPTWNPVGDDE